MIRRVCVTGGAGFIGSNFVDHLLADDVAVRVVDNFRTGRPEFVDPRVELHEGDVHDYETLYRAFDGCDWVAHFQANADVRHGLERPFFDLEQNTYATATVLDAMRHVGVSRIFFASTASVYGGYQGTRVDVTKPGDTERHYIQTDGGIPEDAPFPAQNSLYGASKVACEGLISAYCEGFGFTSVVGRWVQIVGERYLHGHVIDFVRKLRRNPAILEILGDGKQRKSGLYVGDLVRGIWAAMRATEAGHNVYNFGTDEMFTVDESADLICDRLAVAPAYSYTGRTNGGWVGDNPHVLLDSTKARGLGWAPELTIRQGILRTVDWLLSERCTYL